MDGNVINNGCDWAERMTCAPKNDVGSSSKLITFGAPKMDPDYSWVLSALSMPELA